MSVRRSATPSGATRRARSLPSQALTPPASPTIVARSASRWRSGSSATRRTRRHGAGAGKHGRPAQEFGIASNRSADRRRRRGGRSRRMRQRSAKKPGVHALAARRAAEDHRLDGEKLRARRELGVEPARKPRAVEKDRLLRQPVEPRACAERQRRADFRRRRTRRDRSSRRPAWWRRRGSRRRARTSADIRSPPVSPPAVLISTASGGSLGRTVRKPHLRSARLVQPVEPGRAAAPLEGDPRRAFRPLEARANAAARKRLRR